MLVKNNITITISNLEYLNSDRVANKDKEEVLGEYSDENVLFEKILSKLT